MIGFAGPMDETQTDMMEASLLAQSEARVYASRPAPRHNLHLIAGIVGGYLGAAMMLIGAVLLGVL